MYTFLLCWKKKTKNLQCTCTKYLCQSLQTQTNHKTHIKQPTHSNPLTSNCEVTCEVMTDRAAGGRKGGGSDTSPQPPRMATLWPATVAACAAVRMGPPWWTVTFTAAPAAAAAAAVTDRVQTRVVSASYFYTWDCFHMGTDARCKARGALVKTYLIWINYFVGLDHIVTKCNINYIFLRF